MYNTRVKLIRRTESGRDNYGNPIIKTETEERWAEVKSVSCSEYYQAATAGMQPSMVIVLADSRDYAGQTRVQVGGIMYDVIRTYIKGHEIEITLTGRAQN